MPNIVCASNPYQVPMKVAGNIITSSITILEQKTGPQFIFGLDMLKRHQVCVWLVQRFSQCACIKSLVYRCQYLEPDCFTQQCLQTYRDDKCLPSATFASAIQRKGYEKAVGSLSQGLTFIKTTRQCRAVVVLWCVTLVEPHQQQHRCVCMYD